MRKHCLLLTLVVLCLVRAAAGEELKFEDYGFAFELLGSSKWIVLGKDQISDKHNVLEVVSDDGAVFGSVAVEDIYPETARQQAEFLRGVCNQAKSHGLTAVAAQSMKYGPVPCITVVNRGTLKGRKVAMSNTILFANNRTYVITSGVFSETPETQRRAAGFIPGFKSLGSVSIPEEHYDLQKPLEILPFTVNLGEKWKLGTPSSERFTIATYFMGKHMLVFDMAAKSYDPQQLYDRLGTTMKGSVEMIDLDGTKAILLRRSEDMAEGTVTTVQCGVRCEGTTYQIKLLYVPGQDLGSFDELNQEFMQLLHSLKWKKK